MYKNKGYALSDIQNEKSCHVALINIEIKIKNHYTSLLLHINLQTENLDQLWELISRLLLLRRGPRDQMIYPEKITMGVETELLTDIHSNIKKIYESNESLCESLQELVLACKFFDDEIRKLDYCTQSIFIEGNCMHKPLFYNIEVIKDLLVYLQQIQSKLNSLAKCLNPYSLGCVEKYKNVLLMKKDKFEEFYKISNLNCWE